MERSRQSWPEDTTEEIRRRGGAEHADEPDERPQEQRLYVQGPHKQQHRPRVTLAHQVDPHRADRDGHQAEEESDELQDGLAGTVADPSLDRFLVILVTSHVFGTGHAYPPGVLYQIPDPLVNKRSVLSQRIGQRPAASCRWTLVLNRFSVRYRPDS
jgi:hypothetical protein